MSGRPPELRVVGRDRAYRPGLAADVDGGADRLVEEGLAEVGFIGQHVILRPALPGSEESDHALLAAGTGQLDARADAHAGKVDPGSEDGPDPGEVGVECRRPAVQVLVTLAGRLVLEVLAQVAHGARLGDG